ncbi:Lipoprotein-releasing system ATP-binding protein LolD [Collinsella aerofaciens]|uniref:Lipoprotein-releasing system ATP-binding protein LolD n=2 Tax=Collinsella aerofaciens TaxID=74426 RepID=A0A5K1JEJ2_9ACTN|nr:Lipoprotein-releasing system ATP-binding protein LolD [Collinsella aerofaciens]
MSGLDAPDEGRVLVAGRDLYAMGGGARTRFLRQAAAFVFQSYNLVPYLTVEENATLPIALARGKVDRGRLRDLLGRFGLADRAKAPAGGLSGGEQQRAALVRALLSRPAVLFADEPTGALDTRNTALVLGVLREMADAGTTVVMVTHDVDAAATADRVAFVRDGLVTRVAGHCTPEQVLAGTREGAIGRG